LPSVRGLVKRYAPDRTALAGINLTARSGEIVGLLGANGAGKQRSSACTTQVRASAGTVRLTGLDVARHPSEVKRQIGVVTQPSTIDRSMRVARCCTGTAATSACPAAAPVASAEQGRASSKTP
jgi:ABC-type multidrug transport system ATPase subunit